MPYATVAQLRAYLPQVPEYGQQRIAPTASAFTLAYDGASTSSLARGATATTVQSALRAISAIGASGVKVSGAPGGPWVAAFQGDLAQNAALLLGTGAAVEPATDALLLDCLSRASDTVRQAMRRALADPTFDYADWPEATARIVVGSFGAYVRLPPHQAGSVTLVEYQTTSSPIAYATLPDAWDEEDGRLYRPGQWAPNARYRITAQWGYGPDVPQAIEQITLELAVNIWRSRDKGGFTELVGAEGGGAVRVVAGLTKQQDATIRNVAEPLMELAI